MDFLTMNTAVQMHNDAANTAMQMHSDAVNMHNQMQQQSLLNQQIQDTFTKTGQTPVKMGILPPKVWKPDPYAGLGPELSPEEKLKKKYEDLKKPMYIESPKIQVEDKPHKKTFKEKVHDFVHKVNEKIKTFSQNILCSVKNVFHKTAKN